MFSNKHSQVVRRTAQTPCFQLFSVSLSVESGMNHTEIRVEQITSSHFFPALTKRGHGLVFFFSHPALGSLRVTESPDRLKLTQYSLYCIKLSHLCVKTDCKVALIYDWESSLLPVFAKWKVQQTSCLGLQWHRVVPPLQNLGIVFSKFGCRLLLKALTFPQ